MKLIKLFSREYSVQYTEASLRSLGYEAKEHLPALLLSQCYLPEYPNETCYGDPGEWNHLIESLGHEYSTKEKLTLFMERFHHYGKAYITTALRLGSIELKKVTTAQIIGYYQEYQNALIVYSTYLWMGYLLNNIYTDQAKKLFDTKSIVHRDAVEAVLLSPRKRTGILELQTTLSQIDTPALSPKQIEDILKNFGWIPCLDIQNNPWTNKDVQSFFRSFKKPTEGMPLEIAMKEVNLSPAEQEWFALVRELVYVKDMRDEYRRRGICAILPLFDEIAARCAVTRAHIAYFTSDEIVEALKDNQMLSTNEAEVRQTGFWIHWENTAIVATTNTATIKEFQQSFIRAETITNVLKGTPACTGTATGRVVIVRGVADLVKVQDGDVMVAVTTHPDFVPAMHHAAAIVTDEGGLTSHAAIVSRELKIPCIVGAKNATQSLHDGDRVEVDANQGIINRIN